jgi:multisubunit Na+/H+ antiporter MnhE subunit
VRAIARWAVAWVALAGLWLLYQGEWNAIQLYAAGSAATLSLVLALLVRRFALPAARVEVKWIARAAKIPWLVLREFGLVTSLLVRALAARRVPTGEFREVPFSAGGARPAERGRRAFVALATGYSPNSYVVDVDEERNVALVHVLAPVPSGEELV